jgi:hypothetical protein
MTICTMEKGLMQWLTRIDCHVLFAKGERLLGIIEVHLSLPLSLESSASP